MSDNKFDISSTGPKLGGRFDEALLFASEKHHTQTRKGTGNVPYLAHLMSVAALVLEAGGDEELAIAALLHDVAEDQGGEAVLMQVRDRFGARVEAIVRGCSDTFESTKPPWSERKRAYVEHIRHEAGPDVAMVSAADKVHNARSILTDHFQMGDVVFTRFNAGKEQTMWYYHELVNAFQQAQRRNGISEGDRNGGLARLTEELERVVLALEARTAAVGGTPCRE